MTPTALGEAQAARPESAPEGDPAPAEAAGLGFWLFAGHLWTVFGLAISNVLLGLSLVAAPFAAVGAGRRTLTAGGAGRRACWLLLALAAYAALLVLSAISSLDPGRSVRGLTELFNLMAVPLALLLVRGESRVRTVIDGIALIGGLLALHGLGQFALGYNDLSHRITGPFSHYMTFSGVLLVADLVLIARAATRRDEGWGRAWRWVCLVLINAALLATYTRSAWVGLAVALTLLLVVRAPKWLLAYPVAALLFALLAPSPVLDRALSIADIHDPSNQDRLSMARAAGAMIADRPVVGLGPEMVRVLYPEYRLPTAVRDNVPHLHDTFLQIAAERGLPALAAYFAIMAIGFCTAWRRFRSEGGFRGARSDLYLGVLLVLIGFNVAGLFEHNWGDTEVQRQILFFLVLPFCIDRSD